MSVKIRCRDLLALEHPECINESSDGGCIACPKHYGYLSNPEHCMLRFDVYLRGICDRCWDREIEIDDERAEKLGLIKKEK